MRKISEGEEEEKLGVCEEKEEKLRGEGGGGVKRKEVGE